MGNAIKSLAEIYVGNFYRVFVLYRQSQSRLNAS